MNRVWFGCILACACGVVWGVPRAAENPLAAARDSITQWVQTQQLISRTRTEWESDREMLDQSKLLLERELAAVKEQMARLSTNSSVADEERLKAEADLKTLNAAIERARTVVASLESEVRTVIPLLPPPLLATVETLVQRLPADPNTTKAGLPERLQTVVALLNEVDKFNNSVVVSNERRDNAAGQPVAVDVLYVGLGQAFFTSASGDVAGVGAPGPDGWAWKLEPGLSGPIRDAIAMYRSQKPAAFLSLPVVVR